jgi:hypothetical protein
MSSNSDFYEALDCDQPQLRLVAIDPGPSGSKISCKLETHAISATPVYEALSYCWGDSHERLPIFLDGSPFTVTTNLEAALRHLRHATQIRTLWIDAVCINQADTTERTSQVRQMGTIYRNASQTAVWLGQDARITDPFFGWLNDAHNFLTRLHLELGIDYQRDGISLKTPISTPVIDQIIDKFKEYILCVPDALEMLTLFWTVFTKQPWFERVWVVQEVSLAKKVTLYFGEHSVDWDIFREVYPYLTTSYVSPASITQDPTGIAPNIFGQLLSCSSSGTKGMKLPITKLVALNCNRKATDPRDHVYAFLGLASSSIHPLLDPDYSEDVLPKDVYMNLVEYSMTVEQSLDILTMNEVVSREQDTSWCPTWSNSLSRGHFFTPGAPFPLLSKFGIDEENAEGNEFQASSCLPPDATIDRQSGILTCSGLFIDIVEDHGKPVAMAVTELSAEAPPVIDFHQWEEVLLKKFGNVEHGTWIRKLTSATDTLLILFQEILPAVKLPFFRMVTKFGMGRIFRTGYRFLKYRAVVPNPPYVAGGNTLEAYIRTLCTDRTAARERLTEEAYEAFWGWSYVTPSLDPAVKQQGQVVGFSMLNRLLHRSLFVTEKGYIGLGPAKIQNGDMVCIIYGCSVPLILRAQNDHHILVGEAYVHGIMDGEVIDLFLDGKVEEREFRLK